MSSPSAPQATSRVSHAQPAADTSRIRTVAILGLGYVGLPLATQFGRTDLRVIGYDINEARIAELQAGTDSTNEITAEDLAQTTIEYTANPELLKEAEMIIVTVPTPVTPAKKPDLSLVEAASRTVGKHLANGAIVVYESTVYPGVTEEICAPILEQESGMKWKKDFFLGYSPERVNPGDTEHTIDKIVKVAAGDTKESAQIIADCYARVCKAGVHIAPNIKTAEAAKVIENTQRDLNIALINELALIFHRIGIDTTDVLEAAATKWNFHPYRPGLVGGHCLPADPYYLVHKAEELGYHPQVIAAGRRVNDSMSEVVADATIKALIQAGKQVQNSSVLVLGLTFKENVPDYRDSKIKGTINKLASFGIKVTGHDPLITQETIANTFGIPSVPEPSGTYDAVVIATPHDSFGDLESLVPSLLSQPPVIIDIKSCCPSLSQLPSAVYWRL